MVMNAVLPAIVRGTNSIVNISGRVETAYGPRSVSFTLPANWTSMPCGRTRTRILYLTLPFG